jgi:hypothetical protein
MKVIKNYTFMGKNRSFTNEEKFRIIEAQKEVFILR